MVSDTNIRTGLVNFIKGVDPTAKVHRRRRYPQQERIEEYQKIYRNDDGIINTYMLRRLRRLPQMTGVPKRLRLVTYVFEIRFYLGFVESDDDAIASEEKAQLQIDQLAAAFEADNTIGLDRSVSHNGLAMPSDFEDVAIGDWAAHRALLLIEVTVANVNCGG